MPRVLLAFLLLLSVSAVVGGGCRAEIDADDATSIGAPR
jgi:hypothetical protein